MNKTSLLAVAVGFALLLGANAFAQDQPTKIEVGVDYSLVDFNPNLPGTSSQVVNGGGGSVVYFPASWFGIKMDLQGYANTTQHIVIPAGNAALPSGGIFNVSGNLFTYMFGPEIKKRGKFEPFAEMLFGGAHSNVYGNLFTATGGSASAAPDNNSFAFTVGGGLDIHIKRTISVRPVEVGYLLTKFGNPYQNSTQNSFRYAAGITFNLK
jgi:opacity protein-like surface antigen